MKSALSRFGTVLCMCGIAAAQQPAHTPDTNQEKAIPISGGCVPVGSRPVGYWDAQQRSQITVNLWAKPLSGASVEVYRGAGLFGERPDAKPTLVLTSDADGRVVLPWLRPGKYYILGRSKPDRRDYLWLEISPSGRKWDDLVLNLDAVRGSAEWAFGSLGTGVSVNRISTFRGVVEDFGKPVPDANIDVFGKNLGIDQRPIHLRSGTRGEFSATLPDGQYAVHIGKDISESLFWVDISREATSAALQVSLCKIVVE